MHKQVQTIIVAASEKYSIPFMQISKSAKYFSLWCISKTAVDYSITIECNSKECFNSRVQPTTTIPEIITFRSKNFFKKDSTLIVHLINNSNVDAQFMLASSYI